MKKYFSLIPSERSIKSPGFISGSLFFVLLLLLSCNPEPDQEIETPVSLLNREDSLSYALGTHFAEDLRDNFVHIDDEMFYRGMRDHLRDQEPVLPDSLREALLVSLSREILAGIQARLADLPAENLRRAQEFLRKNKEESGVVSLPSGLQYRIEKPGLGRSPSPADSVWIEYRGTTLGGAIVDSSAAAQEIQGVPIQGLVDGLGEALVLMREGEEWELWIPPGLAYGREGLGDTIAPNELLIYQLKLLRFASTP